jgi:2-methylaconitate isomerase
MTARSIPAVFMRGGTSKGLMFRRDDLPAAPAEWDPIFCRALGSPDPHGRQLDGMGGGLSSLSKVCVVGPSSRPDADVDYTFGQVLITDARVDYSGNCGNMSSAVGPFAVRAGLVAAGDGEITVRIHNTNTRKVVHATFEVRNGEPLEDGGLAIPGVAGTAAPIRLDFMQPGGAITGRLLPTGRATESLDVPGHGRFDVSMVDAAVAAVLVRAEALGLTGAELPATLERDARAMETLLAIRARAAVAMGIADNLDAARARITVPAVGVVAPSIASSTLSGEWLQADDMDLTVRMIASGQPHRALPLTASVCLAVAASLPGTVVHDVARRPLCSPIRLGMPSGVLAVAAQVDLVDGEWRAVRGSFYRTARRLFAGAVFA